MCAVAGGMALAVGRWFISMRWCVYVFVCGSVDECLHFLYVHAHVLWSINSLFSAKVSQLLIRSLVVTLRWHFGR